MKQFYIDGIFCYVWEFPWFHLIIYMVKVRWQ